MSRASKVAFDANLCTRNRNAWTAEQIAPYLGHWVAWNLDGRSIFAHREDLREVLDNCTALGLGGEDYLLECLPSGDELEA